jgi:transposase-like protein
MNELFADQALIEAIQTLGKKMKSPADLAMLNSELVRITVEAALIGEMEIHLGYSKHAPAGYNTGNSRNGYNRKTLKGQHGEIEIADSPRKPMQVIFFNELAVSEQRIKNAMSTFG